MLNPKTRSSGGHMARDGTVRVLVVEDDSQVRGVMEETFAEEGFQIESAGDVQSALALIRVQDFDIVVADGRLPDGTGMEVADAAWERDTPALIVTAYAFDLRWEKWDLASYNIIQKPVLPSQLVMAVNGLLRLRRR